MGTLLTDYIRVYGYDAREILAQVEKLDGWSRHGWYDAGTGTTSSYADKELEIRSMDDIPALQEQCANIALHALKSYASSFMHGAAVNSMSPPRLNRYQTGTLMRRHVDHIHSLFDGQNKGIPSVTILCALNSNYEGGELIVCDQTVKLAAGEVVVFPSCFLYPHEVLEVTSGTRYSFVSWAW